MITPPGELGADVAFGSAQRFGVPMGYGGPHAAFFATRDAYKRSLPGRIIGVSKDTRGRPALRLALQTREQHIHRETANSNICTAQVLLANMASFYAVYHGPQGLAAIAHRIHRFTDILASGLKTKGLTLKHDTWFDTITIELNNKDAVVDAPLAKGMNLRTEIEGVVGVSLDESTTRADIADLFEVFLGEGHGLDIAAIDTQIIEEGSESIPAELARTTEYSTHQVFNSYHSETEMLRYIKSLENKDLALNHSMISLGSCTMKLNAVAEMIPVTWPEFGQLHPFAPVNQALGYLKKQANTGAVTYIQRFGSALNLNIHFHMLFLDGVITREDAKVKFSRVKAPSHADMEHLVHVISHRIAAYLERAGLIERDANSAFLDLPLEDEDGMLHLHAASVNYRIAVGKDIGKKVFTLQTLPAQDEDNYGQLAQIVGFSLHAGVFADTHQAQKLERLFRYIARPTVSEKRLSLTATGNIRYELKTPYKDGTTHVFFPPFDFISKLAALVPPPRLNLTRFCGVFAPNSNVRARVTASQRGKKSPRLAEQLKDPEQPYHAPSMSWAQRLKRVFNIDITVCEECKKTNVKIIACITEAAIIQKVLTHLDKQDSPITANSCKAPPLNESMQLTRLDDFVIQRDFDFGA